MPSGLKMPFLFLWPVFFDWQVWLGLMARHGIVYRERQPSVVNAIVVVVPLLVLLGIAVARSLNLGWLLVSPGLSLLRVCWGCSEFNIDLLSSLAFGAVGHGHEVLRLRVLNGVSRVVALTSDYCDSFGLMSDLRSTLSLFSPRFASCQCLLEV